MEYEKAKKGFMALELFHGKPPVAFEKLPFCIWRNIHSPYAMEKFGVEMLSVILFVVAMKGSKK